MIRICLNLFFIAFLSKYINIYYCFLNSPVVSFKFNSSICVCVRPDRDLKPLLSVNYPIMTNVWIVQACCLGGWQTPSIVIVCTHVCVCVCLCSITLCPCQVSVHDRWCVPSHPLSSAQKRATKATTFSRLAPKELPERRGLLSLCRASGAGLCFCLPLKRSASLLLELPAVGGIDRS